MTVRKMRHWFWTFIGVWCCCDMMISGLTDAEYERFTKFMKKRGFDGAA